MMDGVWYMDMPVSNVIRSTGKPGKIHISVSASGLTSGTYDIDAEETTTDNSVISEPPLLNEGRIGVAKILLTLNRLDEVPREIKETTDELNLGQVDKREYTRLIRDYIRKNNPVVDTTTIEFRALSDLFAIQLLNSNGRLIADDFNFSVNHYNNCRLISGYINATKLPLLFKDGLKKYYSEALIKKGSEKDAGEEMNWLNWIPSGGTVVIVQSENATANANLKGAVYTKSTELEEIISVVYPQFVKFSPEARERALVFTSKANPYVHVSSVNEGDKTIQKNISYRAEKGQPILIPLLKFISE
jgi:hypothetical protein